MSAHAFLERPRNQPPAPPPEAVQLQWPATAPAVDFAERVLGYRSDCPPELEATRAWLVGASSDFERRVLFGEWFAFDVHPLVRAAALRLTLARAIDLARDQTP